MCQVGPLPSTNALTQLPWFELRQGRLAVRNADDIGPVVDVHTHLAFAYLRPIQFDLAEAPGPTRHYQPLEAPLDLEVYANKNLRPADIKAMTRELTLGSLSASPMRTTHSAPNLTREMGELGVATSLLLPIDMPAFSHNAENFLEVARTREELVSLGSVHPFARDVRGKLERQKALGARGIKFHPAVQLVPPDHPRALDLFRLCGELGLPVLSHCGPVGIEARLSRRFSQVRRFIRAIDESPGTTFILGHAGALQMEEALAIARRHPNVYLEIASQSLPNVKTILDQAPGERVLFGSDWPFYHQAIPLAKVLLATEGRPALRRRVLWENATELFGLSRPAAS
jgi:predicted TIM-barrel fold metal-dependent hydrolase